MDKIEKFIWQPYVWYDEMGDETVDIFQAFFLKQTANDNVLT